jgi:outer membrane beta-barrel protein
MTSGRPIARFFFALALAGALAVPRSAAAGKADAFAGKVQPVSGQLYAKRGRLELAPTFNLSLNDAFFAKMMGGVKLGYHVFEWLSVSGQYAVTLGDPSTTGSAVICPPNEGCREADPASLYQVPGAIESIAGGEVAFTPIYGKLNLFAEAVAHVDMSILAGVDYVTYRRVLSAQEAEDGVVPGNESTIGGHLGLGMRVFFTQAFAVRLEVKDYLYAVDVPNVVTDGGSSKDLQNQIVAELGISVFFPFRNRAAP